MLLKLSGVTINIDNKNIVSGVDCNLKSSQVLQVNGVNGAGKTTLMRSIIGEIKHCSGSISFGDDINPRQDILFLGDDYYLNDSLSVLENISYMMMLCCDSSNNNNNGFGIGALGKSIIKKALSFWDIQEYMDCLPGSLSLGQKKKVMLCLLKLLSDHKKLFILDEPANSLDEVSKQKLIRMISDLRDNHGKSFMITNHGGRLLDDSLEINI